jgi:hypothetical protein
MSDDLDCDLCENCKEHADFNEDGESNCCGAPPVSLDEDYGAER